MKFRIPASVAILLCACNFVLAGEKSPLTPKTDFKTMSPEQVLAVLHKAEGIKVNIPKVYCNGKKPSWLQQTLEMECAALAFDGNQEIHNSDVLLHDMEALFRGCGIYATMSGETWGDERSGYSCGLLGSLFFAIGNTPAARTVWEQAPGCHSHDMNGHDLNGCMAFIVGNLGIYRPRIGLQVPWVDNFGNSRAKAYDSDHAKLVAMAHDACTNVHDASSCLFLQMREGQKIDWETVKTDERERRQDRREHLQADEEQRHEQAQESNARFNAVIGAMQSMPGASDPNAVINAGNQQAAAIRAVGDANAVEQQAAAQQRLTSQQAAQLAAQQRVAAQQAANQNASSSTPSGSTRNSGGNTSATAGQYAASLSATCIRGFWDPKFYSWLSFENQCGQAIHLSFVATSASDTFGMSSTDIAPGQASNTGWSQDEVNRKGGFALFVCPAGYVAVDASTGQTVSRSNQDYRCKKW